jgi:hypothetical protein
MSQSNHYSLASPTSLLLDDGQIIERVFSHIDNKTTDLGSEIWREPVKNYVDQERFDKEIKLLRSQPVPFCPSSALPEKGSYVSRIAAGTPILVTRDEEGRLMHLSTLAGTEACKSLREVVVKNHLFALITVGPMV